MHNFNLYYYNKISEYSRFVYKTYMLDYYSNIFIYGTKYVTNYIITKYVILSIILKPISATKNRQIHIRIFRAHLKAIVIMFYAGSKIK